MQSAIQLTLHLIRSIPFFSQKNFEPLKRLTQCRSILFSKIYCNQQHILPVRFHRFTATDGGGYILAMFCRKAKLETQNRTRTSDFEYLTGKSGMDAADSMQKRRLRLRLKLDDEKCTRTYIFHQGRQARRKPRKLSPLPGLKSYRLPTVQ